jgi:hypothetical protein
MSTDTARAHRWRRRAWRALGAAILVFGTAVAAWANDHAMAADSYVLRWQTIVSGGVMRSHSSCYEISGAIAQPVVTPGISMSSSYTLFSGFWSAAPIANQDKIFSDGFEDCTP